MINLVVYGDNNTFMKRIIKSIEISLFNYGIKYHIDMYDKYTDEMDLIIRNESKKIYLLDKAFYALDVDIISKIRKYDRDNIIIMINKDYNSNLFDKKMIIIDMMSFCDNYYNDLYIDNSYEEINLDKKFTFKYKRVVYRIPFKEITYIEKESNVKRCIIHTIDNSYYIIGSLNSILNELDNNFCRTHQSCIVNLNNIKKIELGSNMVIFKNNDRTDLITNKTKKEIKKYIGIS